MASMHWGRKETIIFPPHTAIYTYGAVFFAVILTGLFVYLRFTFGNTPLQRFYTPIYIRSSVTGGVSASRKDKYRLVMIGARGIRPLCAPQLVNPHFSDAADDSLSIASYSKSCIIMSP